MISLEHQNTLKQVLGRMVNFPDSEWARLNQQLSYHELGAGAYFVRAGEPSSAVGFVVSGLLRKLYQMQDGREFIKDFSFESCLVTAYSALLTDSPSHLSIQAIEPTILIIIPYREVVGWYSLHPVWQELGRKIAEGLFIEREQREWQLLTSSARERYEIFIAQYPELVPRVPQYDIASYLGISPVSLSRLVGKKRDQKRQRKG